MKRTIPSTGEQIPVIGLGTWQTFDVTGDETMKPLSEVLEIMKEEGGKLIDASPMYGNAEKVIGTLTDQSSPQNNNFFYATKVWMTGKHAGIKQIEASFEKMKRKKMDLIQVHNMTDWRVQLQTLREWKEAGKIRYIGVTHYADYMHDKLERIIGTEEIDFVQFNYSIFSRHAEKRLLRVAADKGVATIINRPFGQGSDFSKVKDVPLPAWTKDYSIESWSQFFLLYIISHPSVTVAIPATSCPKHALENFKAAAMPMVDEETRSRMVSTVARL